MGKKSIKKIMKNEIIFLQSVVLIPASGKELYNKKIQDINTFSCKINGELFLPGSYNAFQSPQVYGGYSNNFTIVRITAKCSKKRPYKYIIIELNNFSGTGEYLLSDINNDCRYEEFYPDNTYKSTLTKNGKVRIVTDDRVNFILSGTFEFIAANTTNPLEKIIISQGHFYLKL